MRALLRTFSWQELRHHPWRNAAAVLAVMLGVALAFSVHLINNSALSEFSQAVRAVNGQPDLELRAVQGSFDESLYQRVANHPQVAMASPVLEITSYGLDAKSDTTRRQALRIIGVDALAVASIAPALMPVPFEDAERLALFLPATVFLNPAARQVFSSNRLQLQDGLQLRSVLVAGSVNAGGGPLAVMDIGAAQDLFGRAGQLSRIDVRLKTGTDMRSFAESLQLPPGITASAPGDDAERVSNLSRAYRVNLTVLALVALFTGAFLVFSVLSLSVAKRAQQFALLGVLGLSGRECLQIVLIESLALGVVGSVAGIALGTGLAALALRLLGGDLGGGYFSGVAPALQWSSGAALTYGALGVVAAGVGGWWPARAAQKLPPAQTLKGLGVAPGGGSSHWLSLLLLAAGGLLALLPPVFGIPLAAYFSVGLLLVGGITALPWLITLLYDRLSPWVAHRLLPLLAVERARRVRESAAVAVSGVVASLSLAVALTVMVASFRDSVTHWLDVVLPADLYVRTTLSTSASDAAYFSPGFVESLGGLAGVARVSTLRSTPLLLDAGKPAVTLISRPIDDPATSLPMVGAALPVPDGQIGIYVSEAMVDLYGARPGTVFLPLSQSFSALAQSGRAQAAIDSIANQKFYVAGVWRDYARQFGAIAMPQRDFERLSGDRRVNDVALWLNGNVPDADVQQAIRQLADAQSPGGGALLEMASVSQIRTTSLKIFDRSFAVTYWLQGVAIAIGLFGVAASFSAQVLARRKEFGLLVHLGLTRRQILTVVAGEGAAWTVIGAFAGLALGLAVSTVLVFVVNPQSFHWTMDLQVPWARLLLLCAAVVAAGTLTAWLAGRSAAGRDAVLAVKEDW
ncbi:MULTISPECIES: FtsX-like permease family protein [unclassified Polaromonas]|uniref:FtsX-like permease family protein n=1 Tax=unclassified Polaromonas TaxID=2638319 RepID=UPI0018C9524D|nr:MULTISPECIES: ABC transporter permease [unclassified Polaromonas]MBG6071248.1 putative ABC transport system permease protein [Polaromonas sp. CG_9.7]MBG6113248.1 putative ABC transport system permease protein [Polaromonas sp. CG_9.2]